MDFVLDILWFFGYFVDFGSIIVILVIPRAFFQGGQSEVVTD